MSDSELIGFFKGAVGNVCGRFQPEQLHRDLRSPRKGIFLVKYFFRMIFPALLVSVKAGAQKESTKAKVAMVCTKEVIGDTVCFQQPLPAGDTSEISGRVVDRNGMGIPYASVMIKGTNKGVACDNNGFFSMRRNGSESILAVSSVGMVTKEVTVNAAPSDVIMLDEALLGEVVVVGLIVPKTKKREPLFRRIMDTAFSPFSIYPNPAPANALVSINTQRLGKADYMLWVTAINGVAVQSRKISVHKKSQVFSFKLENVVAGNYLVQLVNGRSGKTYTEKLTVQ